MEKLDFNKHVGFSKPIWNLSDIISDEELNEVERQVNNLLINERRK
jgi:hypothetical protein